MYGHGKTAALVILVSLTGVPLSSWARPPLASIIGDEAALPAKSARIPLVPKTQVKTPGKLNPELIARDPNALVKFFEEHPERMSVETMRPALVLTMQQLLLDGRAWLVAEKLMHDAVTKWADRPDLKRAYGRILIQLGRPSHAAVVLKDALRLGPENASGHFLYGLSQLRVKPSTVETKRIALKSLRRTLELSPSFTDMSGWSARDIKRQVDRMLGRSTRPAGHPVVP